MAGKVAHHFLPWVRQGVSAGVSAPDTLAAGLAAQITLPVTVQFERFPVSGNVSLYGPGDVTGLDARQVIRTQPRHLTTNFEPNFFPSIEFDRPDLPWLFTPLSAGAKERLRPWMVLVVVPKQTGVTLGRDAVSPLPVLEIASPARPGNELPDLGESWAWAHAHVTADLSADVKSELATAPERNVSRLLCPRKLTPFTAYFACVVPAFEAGRQAGLALPVTETTLAAAWTQDATNVRLPVYYSWEFTTGAKVDFELLAKALAPRPVPSGVGARTIDVGHGGFSLPALADSQVPLRGMLLPTTATEAEPAVPEALAAGIAGVLTASAATAGDPVVAPPMYGGPYAAANAVPPWMMQMNFDPRHRIAAALGTQIVQQDQEDLMASAWAQAETVKQANQRARLQLLALAGRTKVYERHYRGLTPDARMQITGLCLAKVAVDAGAEGKKSLAWQVEGSTSPAYTTAVARRVTRIGGPVFRRSMPWTERRTLVGVLNDKPAVLFRKLVIPTSRAPVGTMVTLKAVSDLAATPLVNAGRISASAVLAAVPPAHFAYAEDREAFADSGAQVTDPVKVQFRQAAAAHLAKAFPTVLILARPAIRKPDTQVLLKRIDPKATPPVVANAADQDRVLYYPRFPAPMSERLIELAPEFLLPGLDQVPANSVTLVRPNTPFIESFMVGLNHEMGRELLWREYPCDTRGTYFTRFWNQADGADQFAPITQWNGALGKNLAGPVPPLILLLRGELFRRYPTAIVYAVPAVADAQGFKKPSPTGQRYPLFRGASAPDITFFGFALTEAEARTGNGWFFVIQQQPGEPDFGLDLPADPVPQPAAIGDWNNLTWRHLVNSAAELDALTYVSVKPGPLPAVSGNPGAIWGENAAHIARATLQQPVRIAIHALKMLP